MSETFESKRAPEPVGAFPHAKRVGELLFLSGIGPRVRGSKEIPGVTLDSAGNVVSYDIETQSLPSSLAATLRGFTFYLADPVSSIHRLGLQKSSIRVHLWRNQSDMSAAKSFRIISADHTGITVSNLERSLAFWRDVLGFE